MGDWQVEETLKQDQFGRVERVGDGERVALRRVACGSRVPLSRVLGRRLARREQRALRALAGGGPDSDGALAGVPLPCDDAADFADAARAASADGRAPAARDVTLRSWQAGAPLHRATALPADFFDLLDALVARVHARGVCHNDLHKEQNIVVGEDGRPALIDFQLASVHPRRGRRFASRARDDLRHLQKHRRRYTRDGRGPTGAAEPQRGAGHGIRRSPLAAAWRRWGKPVYHFVTRRVLGTRDGEDRRPSSGPWPRWTPPVGAARGSPDRAGDAASAGSSAENSTA